MDSTKRKLLGMTLPQIKDAVTEIGMPAFTAKQIADWIYCKRVSNISEMTNSFQKVSTILMVARS